MYRETITTEGTIKLADHVAPRIEPEVALFIENGEMAGWAPAFEIVDAHFPGWNLSPADAIADAGLHVKLILGERHSIDLGAGDPFGERGVTLRCNGAVVERGICTDVIGGPLRVWSWLRDRFVPSEELGWEGVEVVTTGSLTTVPYLKANECWDFSIDGYLGGSPVLEVL
jgi:2-oxo-3-hexenedioate decarboxylase